MFRLSAFVVCLLICCLCSRASFAAAASGPRSDELFADYRALVRANFQPLQLPVGPAAYSNISYNPAVLSQETLATLEQAHGGDARYWELRYWCLQMESLLGRGSYGFDAGWAAQEDDRLATELLLQASDCGGASPFALYSLAQIQRDQRKREIAAIESDPGLAEDERREALINAMAADEEEFARALERINAAWPDEAWPCWWHADELFNLGELDQACDWLEDGNAAANCSYPACWPESYFRGQLALGQQPGPDWLCGAVLMAGQTRSFPSFIRWKEHMKEAEMACKLGGDLRAFNSLQSFSSRQAGAAGTTGYDCLLPLVFAKVFSGVLLRNNAEDLSQSQIGALLDLQFEVDSLQRRLRTLERDNEVFNDQFLGAVYTDLFPADTVVSELDASRERLQAVYRLLPRRRYSVYCTYIQHQLETVHADVAPRLAALGRFDFVDPQTRPEWTIF